MAKHRVSAKQRLDLIREAYQALYSENVRDISSDDLQEFVSRVQAALNNELEPRSKTSDEDTAPF